MSAEGTAQRARFTTSAPWEAIGKHIVGERTQVAYVYTGEDDAMLVAAAPDLYEAAKVALYALENAKDGEEPSDLPFRFLSAALNKAEGR